MYCKNCGRPLDPGARFCPGCGTPAESAPAAQPAAQPQPAAQAQPAAQPQPGGRFVTKNIMLCDDGKYRWFYKLSLYRNPTILLLIWKIFFFIILGIFVFMSLITLFEDGFDAEVFLNNAKMMGIILGVFTVLVLVSYWIYAMIMGGVYFVRFEMDENGVNHAQMPVQAKKAKKIGAITALAGAATGNLSMVGLGMNTSANTEMYSSFPAVKKVKCYPRRNLIKVNQTLTHNQVYAEKEDFDFVSNFILSHCPGAKR